MREEKGQLLPGETIVLGAAKEKKKVHPHLFRRTVPQERGPDRKKEGKRRALLGKKKGNHWRPRPRGRQQAYASGTREKERGPLGVVTEGRIRERASPTRKGRPPDTHVACAR